MILPVAWAASSLGHLMLAEVLFRTGRDLRIVNNDDRESALLNRNIFRDR